MVCAGDDKMYGHVNGYKFSMTEPTVSLRLSQFKNVKQERDGYLDSCKIALPAFVLHTRKKIVLTL